MLGKRKRNPIDQEITTGPMATQNPTESAREAFRKHFETMFEPLPESTNVTRSLQHDASTSEIQDYSSSEEQNEELPSDTDSQVSTWSGLSEDTPVAVVEVIEIGGHADGENELDTKLQKKAFMGTAPPRDEARREQAKKVVDTAKEEFEEKANLKHDLDLQRLLQESHLLEQSKTSALAGKQRHIATDMRMQSLGSKTSVLKQKKMPVSHLVGIRKKATTKEHQRRQHAQENGIVLEKSSGSSKRAPKRDRGVDAPGLGKFRGGTLQLSRADIASIQGPARGGKRGRGRGRR